MSDWRNPNPEDYGWGEKLELERLKRITSDCAARIQEIWRGPHPPSHDPIAASISTVQESMRQIRVMESQAAFHVDGLADASKAESQKLLDVLASEEKIYRQMLDDSARAGTLADTFADLDFLGERITFLPVLGHRFRVFALGIDDRVGMRGATRQQQEYRREH